MRKIYQYILMAVALMATASCSNELDEALQPVGNGNLQFVVGDFPAFGEGGQTRAVGLEDAGKTAWEDNDKILVHLYSQEYGNQAVELTFKNGDWKSDGGTLSYLNDETPTITAVYAPDCEIKSDNTIGLIDDRQYGEAEYILAKTTINGNTLDIRFESGRTYSRLRIATMPKATLTVTTGYFTPAGPNGTTAPESYTLTTDDDGNAYLYGTFAKNGTVTATAKHEIYPTDGITETSRTSAFDDRPSTSGQSYVLGVKLGDKVDAQQAFSGDVALKDGSFVSNAKIAEMTDVQKSAMAGIVFWTVVETDPTGRTYPASLTDDKVMNADFPHCTQGLIVSLTNTETMAWQSTAASVADWQETKEEFIPSKTNYVSIKQSSSDDAFNRIYGYQLTKILKAYNEACDAGNVVQPIEALSEFAESNPAPLGSTGWYLPSAKELYILCNEDIDDITTVADTKNKQFLNTYFTELGKDNLLEKMYWSSMESIYTSNSVAHNFLKNGFNYENKMNSFIVRYVCAF